MNIIVIFSTSNPTDGPQVSHERDHIYKEIHVTSESKMFLFLDLKCMGNEHKKGNQQHKRLNSDILLNKKDINHFQRFLIEINRKTSKIRTQNDIENR